MKLDALRPILDHPGPFTSVHLDATRSADAADKDVRGRWLMARRRLEEQGAPPEPLETLADVVLRRGRASGAHGRFVVLGDGEVLLDVETPQPPVSDEATYGDLPSLLPAIRAAEHEVRFLLVEADRSGADLHWSWREPERAGAPEAAGGGHDVLHKVPAGGMSHRRMQARVEDSWERNAQAVAGEIDRLVAAFRPELVLLTGDVRAVGLVSGSLGKQALAVLTEVAGGSRADGVHEGAFSARVTAALDAHRARRRAETLDRLREGLGRGDGGVSGLDSLVEVLRRGQVAEVVALVTDTGSVSRLYARTLWTGPDPLHLASNRGDLADLGVPEGRARKVRADVAVLRALIAQDAGITLVPDGDMGLADGLGALLRWSDPSTPHDLAPSYATDSGRLGSAR